MRFCLSLFFLILSISVNAQNGQEKFLENLRKHCGKAYEGTIAAGGREGDGFTGQRLIMRVISCSENQIKIPFFVGENKSRTWILTQKGSKLELKHDHRREDGTDDKITMYGGTASNTGSASLQFFPADQFTCDMIDYACGNIWWITLDDHKYTYNLRRIGSDRLFSVSFDLTKPIEYSEKPWGWKE